MMRRLFLTLGLLGLGLGPLPGCKSDDASAAAATSVAAHVRIAPVADRHPWVIAFLTEVSITRPPGADAHLDGRNEPGLRVGEPVFEAETQAALADFLASYERTHARPPELAPVWEQVAPGSAGAGASKPWQLHFIDTQAGFELDSEATASIVEGAMGPVVRLQLGAAQRERLASLSEASLGHRVAVVIADDVVMVPIVRDVISGGVVELWTGPGVDPEVAAPALLERLKQPS